MAAAGTATKDQDLEVSVGDTQIGLGGAGQPFGSDKQSKDADTGKVPGPRYKGSTAGSYGTESQKPRVWKRYQPRATGLDVATNGDTARKNACATSSAGPRISNAAVGAVVGSLATFVGRRTADTVLMC